MRINKYLDIGYFANHTQQYSNRDVEPVGIFYLGNYWYMIAYCRLRKDYRNFRTDRISYIKPLPVSLKNNILP